MSERPEPESGVRIDAAQAEYERTYGTITDEGIANLQSRVGKPLPAQDFGPPIPVASEESIRLWAWGIGDDNPLYTSGSHAVAGPWGAITAPPSILLGMDAHRMASMGGLPGVHSLYTGVNWEWHRPIRLGMRIATDATMLSVTERERSGFSGRSVKVISETRINDDVGRPVGRLEHVKTRHERSGAREKGVYLESDEIPYRYSQQELDEIAEQYRREIVQRRGAEPRYWEDVATGDAIPLIIKGPLSATSVVAFAVAVRPVHLTRAHRLMFSLFDRHPALAIPNEIGVPEPPISVHWSAERARLSGLPTAYDFGMERTAWASHLFTDWMGDTGFLKALRVSMRRPNYFGDLTRFTGVVEDRYRIGDAAAVRCSYEGVNQRGEVTTRGQAEVLLPTRDQPLTEELIATVSDGLPRLPLRTGGDPPRSEPTEET